MGEGCDRVRCSVCVGGGREGCDRVGHSVCIYGQRVVIGSDVQCVWGGEGGL